MIDILRNDIELAECMARFFEVEINQEDEMPEDEGGHLKYSLNGKAFAGNGAGGQYILLEDGSIGFWGSEGNIGRLADSIEAFFKFVINCPFWYDYCRAEYYNDIETLSIKSKEIFKNLEEQMKEDGIDLSEKQKYVAEKIGIDLSNDIANDVLMKFYLSTTRSPQFYGEFTEDDGSKHIVDGLLWE